MRTLNAYTAALVYGQEREVQSLRSCTYNLPCREPHATNNDDVMISTAAKSEKSVIASHCNAHNKRRFINLIVVTKTQYLNIGCTYLLLYDCEPTGCKKEIVCSSR